MHASPTRFLLSILAFAIGFDLLLIVLSSFLRLREGSWLPLVEAVLLYAAFTLLPSFRRGVLRECVVLVTLGVVAGYWFLSEAQTGLDRERFSSFFPVLATGLSGLTLLLWLGMPEDRKTISNRTWGFVFVLLVMFGLIAYFSSSQGGGSRMLTIMVDWLHIPSGFAEAILVPLRKTIHFSFYGSVGLTAWVVANRELKPSERGLRLMFGLFCALILASFDEARQSTQPGRTGAVTDVMLDMSGAIVFVALAEFALSRKRPQRPA